MIPTAIKHALHSLISRCKNTGKTDPRSDCTQLFTSAPWLTTVYKDFPIIGLHVGIDESDPDRVGVLFELVDLNTIREMNTECYPGVYLFDRGYIVIGNGDTGAGDVLILDCNKEDPVPYQLWHDVSHNPDELIQALELGLPGTQRLGNSLSDFLAACRVEELS